MSKKVWRPATLLYPVPAVLVSCQGAETRPNIITVAWAGTIASDPPMLSISVSPLRYSHRIIHETREFVVNLPTERLVWATDWCGVKSGRDHDKFATLGLTAAPAQKVKAPLIAECPVNIECKVTQIVNLGSHDLFIAKVEAVDVDEELLTTGGRLNLTKAGLFAYVHGEYWNLKRPIGKFGFSIKKKEPAGKASAHIAGRVKEEKPRAAAPKRTTSRDGSARREKPRGAAPRWATSRDATPERSTFRDEAPARRPKDTKARPAENRGASAKRTPARGGSAKGAAPRSPLSKGGPKAGSPRAGRGPQKTR